MRVYAISDLHLSFAHPKPMDVFGPEWRGHEGQIAENWRRTVGVDDLVLLPGDFCWAMRLEQTQAEWEWLAGLPGRKVLVRGNHDYWWQTISKVRACLPPGVWALQNDALLMDGRVLAGSRGWTCPGDPRFDPAVDEKIYRREAERLRLSLQDAARLRKGSEPIVALLHFPPTMPSRAPSEFSRLLKEFDVAQCVYGHIHGATAEDGAFQLGSTCCRLVAADALNFTPVEIA